MSPHNTELPPQTSHSSFRAKPNSKPYADAKKKIDLGYNEKEEKLIIKFPPQELNKTRKKRLKLRWNGKVFKLFSAFKRAI